jgi:hypothetical protein
MKISTGLQWITSDTTHFAAESGSFQNLLDKVRRELFGTGSQAGCSIFKNRQRTMLSGFLAEMIDE